MPYSKHHNILCYYLTASTFCQRSVFWQYCAGYCRYHTGISDLSLSTGYYDVWVLGSAFPREWLRISQSNTTVTMLPYCDNTSLYRIFHSTRLELFVHGTHTNRTISCYVRRVRPRLCASENLAHKAPAPAQATAVWVATRTSKHSLPLLRRNNASKTTGSLLHAHTAPSLQQTPFPKRFHLSSFSVTGLAWNTPDLQSLSDIPMFE